jgi:hypothetical protein
MCDTILAPQISTGAHVMLFGKNSDRQRNEAQAVELHPAVDHLFDASARCTYITIPQVPHSHAVLLCRPFWIWGAEMGANEHGVGIGNEGLHARTPAPEQNALTGMDLLRLALERSETAAQAVQVITSLLERNGQGGNCGYLKPAYYNNGFMVADRREAFVVETIGREWLVEPVRDVRAMSNRYSIDRATSVSSGLADVIREHGNVPSNVSSLADALANPGREHIGNAGARRSRSTALLKARAGQLDAAAMMRILRDHACGEEHAQEWRTECTVTRTICMHAGAEDRDGQTVGSMVSELHHPRPVHWVTGTAAPCTSIFKPVWVDTPLPSQGVSPTDRFDARNLWWRHERLHRRVVLSGLGEFLREIGPEREALEDVFHQRVRDVLNGGRAADRAHVVAQCWQEAATVEDRWYQRLRDVASLADSDVVRAWTKMNQRADFDARACP